MRGPIELLQDSLAIFQKNPQLYVSIYAVLGVLMVLQSAVTPAYVPGEEMTGSSPQFALVSIAVVVASIFTTIALLKAIAEPETTTVKSAFLFAKKDALAYFILSVMVGITVMVGFFLLIIPGVIALTWFGFAYCTLVFEGKRNIEAMKASKALVDGRFVPVLVRYVALLVVAIVIAIIGGIVASIFGESLVGSLLLAVVYAVMMPVMLAYVYLMYLDVKKEGVYTPATMAAATPVVATPVTPVTTSAEPNVVSSSETSSSDTSSTDASSSDSRS